MTPATFHQAQMGCRVAILYWGVRLEPHPGGLNRICTLYVYNMICTMYTYNHLYHNVEDNTYVMYSFGVSRMSSERPAAWW